MTTNWDCPEARIALGVYVLGVIDADERAAVDAHLDTCQDCRAELAELAELPGLLAMVPAEEAIALAEGPLPGDGPFLLQAPVLARLPDPRAPDPVPAPSPEPAPAPSEPAPSEPAPSLPANVVDLAAVRRRRRGLVSVGAVAAAAVVIGAASFGGVKLAASPASASAPAPARVAQDLHPPGAPNGGWDTVQGGNGGAVATVAFRSMRWGTELAAKVAGLPVGTPCQMWVVKRDGTRLLAGGWTTDADEGAVWYPASAGTSATDIKSFLVTVQGGKPITVTAT